MRLLPIAGLQIAIAASRCNVPSFHPPLPSRKQLKAYGWQFSSFVHFGPTTFLPNGEDNNCATNASTNITMPLASVDVFNPTAEVDTDQWVQTMKSMGSTQVCFTAHHSGGFAMWPTKYKAYTIEHSPYGRRYPEADIVRDFVASCRKFGVSPCLYIAPEVDCDMAMRNQSSYFTGLKGMLRELLTQYGTIDRLWLDTVWTPFNNFPRPNDGRAGGPFGIAPWRDLFEFIGAISPETVTLPGLDGCEVNSDYGYGRYPYMTASVLPPVSIDARLPDGAMDVAVGENCWTIYGGRGVSNLSAIWGGPPQPTFFKVGEDMQSMQRNGEWFMHRGSDPQPWSQLVLAGQYAATVLRGLNWILNIPAGQDGRLPSNYTEAAAQLGTAVRGLRGTTVASLNFTDVHCPGSLTLQMQESSAFNAVALAEDLATTGQVVANYSLSLRIANSGGWRELPRASVPGPAFGQWKNLGGTSIGFGVLDLLTLQTSADELNATALKVSLTGCLTPNARLAVGVRMVELGPLTQPVLAGAT